nr:dynein intermediate chain 1, axonemal-like [Penaeus vannamei]
MVCLFSIKNSRVPEKKFMTDSGVTCVHFHPTGEDFLAAGTKDGSVLVFRLQKKAGSAASSTASPISGKHLLAVTQVKWIQTDEGIGPSFFSIAQDGRVCLWSVSSAGLSHINVLEFPLNGQAREVDVLDDKLRRGTPTSIAVNPADSDRFLLGLDTGLVVGHSRSATTHAIASYRAHVGSVASIAWNRFDREVFGTAAADWTVKIWLVGCFTPIIIVDLGSPVGGLAWASSSSTAFVAVTDDGRAHVFDISFCKTKALCTQRLRLRQGREAALSCVAFSPFEPVILVAGERGFILSLKLSPNLRKQQKEAKGADAEKLKELERKKMERIIATSGIWQL